MTVPGDRARLEAIFRDHYPAVLAYARRRASREVAEDVAAATFAVAWRRAADVPDEPLPWLLGVARRVLASERRSSVRREHLDERLLERTGAQMPLDAGEGGSESVRAALAALPEGDREALLLIAWEGLSGSDAAASLGVSLGSFYVRFHRAKRRLRRELDRLARSTRRADKSPDSLTPRTLKRGEA